MPLLRGQGDLEPEAGDFLEASVFVRHHQGEDFPLVVVRHRRVLDQRAPLRLHFAQPLQEDFETVLAFQEQPALALDDVCARQVCKLVRDAGAQSRIDGVEVDARPALRLGVRD